MHFIFIKEDFLDPQTNQVCINQRDIIIYPNVMAV